MLAFAAALLLAGLLLSAPAQAEDMNYALVYEQAAPSVVFVASFIDESTGKQGSGFVITPDGYILTNRHVIWDDAQKKPAARILVFLRPEKITGRSADDLVHRMDAKLIASDDTLDLALLKIDTGKTLKTLVFSPQDAVKIGLATAAIGHPVGGVRWSLTTGRISGQAEDHAGIVGRRMIQMETPLNPGNSGGPLLNAAGQVLGVNTATLREGPGGVVVEGINFAISGDAARTWVESVMPPAVRQKPKVAKSSEPLKPKQGQKVAAPKETTPGTVYEPDDMQKMVEQMANDIEAEFEQRRKQLQQQGF
jgi:serine protease Do